MAADQCSAGHQPKLVAEHPGLFFEPPNTIAIASARENPIRRAPMEVVSSISAGNAVFWKKAMAIIRKDIVAEQDLPPRVDPDRVTRIVTSYVRHHKIGTDQLAGLIVEVHRALATLGRDVPPVQEPPRPAVPIRRSVEQDHVVCLECGFRARMLRRHLQTAHGLEAAAYRARWKLSADHPLTAPGYSARRSAMAKEIGLGRRAGTGSSLLATGQTPGAEQQASDPAPSRPVTGRGGRRSRRTPAT